MDEHTLDPTAKASDARPDGPRRPLGGEVTVHLLTSREPAWASAPGLRCGPFEQAGGPGVPVSDGPSVVVMDAAILDTPDRAWVAETTSALGPVVVVATDRDDAANAIASGVRATLPMSFLDAPPDLARTLLLEYAARSETTPAGDLVRYTRDAMHEFRTPLTVILEFASLCLDGVGGDLTEKHREYLGHLEGAAEHLGEQLDDFRDTLLLRIGRHGKGPSRRPLKDALECALDAFDGEVEVSGGLDASACALSLDAARFSVALTRILRAARKWSRGGDPIRLEVGPVPDRRDACRVEVNYAGIRPSDEDVRTMRDGLVETEHGVYRSVARVFGLGVAMAKDFIEAEGGGVRLDATAGGGVYVLTLPRLTAPAAVRAAP